MNANGFIISAAFVLLLSAIVIQGDVASGDLPSRPSKKPVRNGLNPLLVRKAKIGTTVRSDNTPPSNEDAEPNEDAESRDRQRLNKKVETTTEDESLLTVHQPNNTDNYTETGQENNTNNPETGRGLFVGRLLNRRVQRGDENVQGAGPLISSAPDNKTKVGTAKRPKNQKGSKLLESGEQRKPINDDNQTLPIGKTASTIPQSDVLAEFQPTVRTTAANKENSNTKIGSNEKNSAETIQYKILEVSKSNTKAKGSKKPVYRKKLSTKSSKIRPKDHSLCCDHMDEGDEECVSKVSKHVTTKKDLTSSTKKSTKKGKNELNLNQRMKPVEKQKPSNNTGKRPLNVKASDSSVDMAKSDNKSVEAIVLEFPYNKKDEVTSNVNKYNQPK